EWGGTGSRWSVAPRAGRRRCRRARRRWNRGGVAGGGGAAQAAQPSRVRELEQACGATSRAARRASDDTAGQTSPDRRRSTRNRRPPRAVVLPATGPAASCRPEWTPVNDPRSLAPRHGARQDADKRGARIQPLRRPEYRAITVGTGRGGGREVEGLIWACRPGDRIAARFHPREIGHREAEGLP